MVCQVFHVHVFCVQALYTMPVHIDSTSEGSHAADVSANSNNQICRADTGFAQDAALQYCSRSMQSCGNNDADSAN